MTTGKPAEWPALPYQEWAETKKTLHMFAQILGKTRLAMAPPQPEWLGTCLFFNSRGLTTGPMPWGTAAVELALDLYDDELRVSSSAGRQDSISLFPPRCVADVFGEVKRLLSDHGIDAELWSKPQEVADAVPLDEDQRNCAYVPEQARNWLRVNTAMANVFEEWRSRFFGRTGLQFWWGAFDLAVLRFTGKHAASPTDRGYIMRYDLDAEFMNAGFWPGDDTFPVPIIYAYIYPQPPGCERETIQPSQAGWVPEMSEWTLRYEDACASGDPRQMILDFLDSVYGVAGLRGGWDLKHFEYERPAPPSRS